MPVLGTVGAPREKSRPAGRTVGPAEAVGATRSAVPARNAGVDREAKTIGPAGAEKRYWLLTTEHLEDRLLFKDAEDFRVGMNYVAVQAHKWQVTVLAFVLMSNHLHFVLLCTRWQAEAFINAYKQEYGRYFSKKYGSKKHLRRNGVDIREVPPVDEALERALAYVQMNCVAANICASPQDYPWGTGACFFNGPMSGMPDSSSSPPGINKSYNSGAAPGNSHKPVAGCAIPGARPLSALSAREQCRLMHSKAKLPGEWQMSEAGYILPQSFVRKDLVERVFRNPRRMNHFLNSSSKAKLRMESPEQNLPAFKDQVIAAAMPDLCWSLFRKRSARELPEESLVELLRQVRYRFSANVNQIARVTGFSYEEAARLLDRV